MSEIKTGHKMIAGFLCFLAVCFPISFLLEGDSVAGGNTKEPVTTDEVTTTVDQTNNNKPSPSATPQYIKNVELNDIPKLKLSINEYLKVNNASSEFIDLVPLTVDICEIYKLNPLRAMAIMIHETDFGRSDAFMVSNNVCGLNWTDRQKNLIGIKSDVYNVAIEKTKEASVMNLIHLLDMYRNFKTPLVTLSDIQTRYAPNNDKRNGLSGMDNSVWKDRTIAHYKAIEKIYINLED